MKLQHIVEKKDQKKNRLLKDLKDFCLIDEIYKTTEPHVDLSHLSEHIIQVSNPSEHVYLKFQ